MDWDEVCQLFDHQTDTLAVITSVIVSENARHFQHHIL